MDRENLHRLTATEAARLMREGAVSAQEYMDACLARVREVDGQVQAWAFLDPDHARAQARAVDEYRLSGQAIGPLHGVPVGIKDIIDTGDMPTENGSVLHAGRTPSRDAAVVTLLRAAGAVIMGKTVTTEFATRSPGKTRNPHNPEHTPGGSSSGSAAAVGAGMVPLALGSQTTGSTIRPASFCGVWGFKPTHGLIPRPGMFMLSRTCDHVGLFARTVENLGDRVEEVELFPSASEAWTWHQIISEAEMAVNLELEWEKGRDRLSEHLRARIERGRGVRALDYLRALSRLRPVYGTFREIFEQRYDAILTPAAPGTAPKGLASTGEPIFSTLWTLCGMPAVSVPLMQGENGLPLGVQLVGPRDGDARLLRTARWLVGHVAK